MFKIRLLGDVHGKFKKYKKDIKDVENSIQLGDMGIGFYYLDHDGTRVPYANPPYDSIMKGNHRCIRGNHDSPHVCQQQSYWIPDGTVEVIEGHKIMYIGGGLSIDRDFRTEGLDYWSDEELSYHKLWCMMDLYDIEKPDIVMTHDCPDSVGHLIQYECRRMKKDISSRTASAFEEMFKRHKPKLWCFGHWHYNWTKEIDGTIFRCVDKNDYIDMILEEGKITLCNKSGQ